MKNGAYGKSRFWRGRGVYAALTVSLISLGAVVAAMAGRSAVPQEDTSQPSEEMVEQLVTNQPDDRTTTTTFATTTVTTTATTAAEEAPDLYILPLSNTVQKPFSPQTMLYSETMQDWRTHGGTDFAGEEGQTVKALAGGTVLAVEDSLLWGGIIVIDHGVGVQSRYCGVTATVREGESVEVGQSIGALSTVPCEGAQTPHLHLEMSVDGEAVDPVTALAKEVRYAEDMTTEETTE